MKLPERITVRAVGDGDLSDVIFELAVTSGTKNQYWIVFPKTDSGGMASLTRDQFCGQFEDHWEEGLMDYNGTVNSANPAVSVHLLDKQRIQNNLRVLRAWPLLKNEKKWWRNREEKIQYWLSCRNDQFKMSAYSWNIEESPETRITVRTIASTEA